MYDSLQKFSSDSSQIVRYVYFRSLARAEQELAPMKTKTSALGDAGRGYFDALRGVYAASKERDRSSFFVKLYRKADPKDIAALVGQFRREAYRPTIDEYERGFLIAWETILKSLSELKEKYPEYPLNDEQPAVKAKAEESESDVEVKPRKKAKAHHASQKTGTYST